MYLICSTHCLLAVTGNQPGLYGGVDRYLCDNAPVCDVKGQIDREPRESVNSHVTVLASAFPNLLGKDGGCWPNGGGVVDGISFCSELSANNRQIATPANSDSVMAIIQSTANLRV